MQGHLRPPPSSAHLRLRRRERRRASRRVGARARWRRVATACRRRYASAAAFTSFHAPAARWRRVAARPLGRGARAAARRRGGCCSCGGGARRALQQLPEGAMSQDAGKVCAAAAPAPPGRRVCRAGPADASGAQVAPQFAPRAPFADTPGLSAFTAVRGGAASAPSRAAPTRPRARRAAAPPSTRGAAHVARTTSWGRAAASPARRLTRATRGRAQGGRAAPPAVVASVVTNLPVRRPPAGSPARQDASRAALGPHVRRRARCSCPRRAQPQEAAMRAADAPPTSGQVRRLARKQPRAGSPTQGSCC
jgi:hypothetical protein